MISKKKLVVLSGAGISAESGISTFRDSNGLWENHAIEDVASPEGFARNPQLVLDFYNQRRRQLKSVQPNKAHILLAELEKDFDVVIITQNVDDLHERAGSTNVIHLHGELIKARPVDDENNIIFWEDDINIGDLDEYGAQLRPHIVWFGEAVPNIYKSAEIVAMADLFLVIGTSLQVYPAAGLVDYVPKNSAIYLIDLHDVGGANIPQEHIFKMKASEGMEEFVKAIIN